MGCDFSFGEPEPGAGKGGRSTAGFIEETVSYSDLIGDLSGGGCSGFLLFRTGSVHKF